MAGADGFGVGQVGGGAGVVQCVTHHNGAGQSVVVIPRGISVRIHMDDIKDICCNQPDGGSVCLSVV